MKIGYFHILKISLYNILSYYPRGNSNLILERLDKNHLNQVIKIDTINEAYQYHMPLDKVPSEELKITSVAFLPKIRNLNLIRKRCRPTQIEQYSTK